MSVTASQSYIVTNILSYVSMVISNMVVMYVCWSKYWSEGKYLNTYYMDYHETSL